MGHKGESIVTGSQPTGGSAVLWGSRSVEWFPPGGLRGNRGAVWKDGMAARGEGWLMGAEAQQRNIANLRSPAGRSGRNSLTFILHLLLVFPVGPNQLKAREPGNPCGSPHTSASWCTEVSGEGWKRQLESQGRIPGTGVDLGD